MQSNTHVEPSASYFRHSISGVIRSERQWVRLLLALNPADDALAPLYDGHTYVRVPNPA